MAPKTLAALAKACALPVSATPGPAASALVEEPLPSPHSSYRCEACKGHQLLPETAAVVCLQCGWRVLMKVQRLPLRVFSTD